MEGIVSFVPFVLIVGVVFVLVFLRKKSYFAVLVGIILSIFGLVLLLSGNEINNPDVSAMNYWEQLQYISGPKNQGNPPMIIGGVLLGAGVIIIVIKYLKKKP